MKKFDFYEPVFAPVGELPLAVLTYMSYGLSKEDAIRKYLLEFESLLSADIGEFDDEME